IDVDKIRPVTDERLYQKEFAKALRTFLKAYNLSSRDISVKSAVGSMCYWIDVRLPHIDRGKTYFEISSMPADEKEEWFAQSRVLEEHRHDANAHMRKIIDAAFPGCRDRSDSMVDYFDFMYTIH